jgi:pyridoxamine 5'-phosphate oxidase
MSLAPWRSLIARSLHLNRALPNARYFQLATLTIEGKPTNRTVVFRGFRDNSNDLQVITDARSEKILQIQANAGGEICWYFPKTREQFRLSGNITIISHKNTNLDQQKLRYRLWQELSDSARLQFAWPSPRKTRSDNPDDFAPLPLKEAEPLNNFCLLLFNPLSVDHLQLKGHPQNRTLYTLDQSDIWQIETVNP